MTDAETAELPLPGLLSRAIGVITSPTATFQRIVKTPKVLGAMALVTFVSVLLSAGFMSSQRGKDAFFNTMYERIQEGNQTADQQARAQQGIDAFQKMADEHPGIFLFFMAGGNLVFLPVAMVILAGILWAIFNAAMGGTATYKHVLSVVAHAGFMLTLQQLVTTPLNYARGSISSATSLGVLLPMFEKGTVMGHFVGAIDLFFIWAIIIHAIGLGVLYNRSSRAIAITFLSIYGVAALGIAFLTGR